MYERRSLGIEEFAIPIAADPNGLDVLIDTMTTVRSFCEHQGIDIENLDKAEWRVEGWPRDSDSDHLVIRLYLEHHRARF